MSGYYGRTGVSDAPPRGIFVDLESVLCSSRHHVRGEFMPYGCYYWSHEPPNFRQSTTEATVYP
jgi:hypothetical protein